MNDYLKLWLTIATRDIGRLGKQRIEAEITQHYEEAYHAVLDEGLSNDEIGFLAVEVLGDPGTAQKRFRKQYLTTKEEISLGRDLLHRKYNICLFLVSFSIIPLPMLWYFGIPVGIQLVWIVTFIGFLWSQWYFNKGDMRQHLIFDQLQNVSFMCLISGPLLSNVPLFSGSILMSWYLVLYMRPLYKSIRLARKLPKQLSDEERAQICLIASKHKTQRVSHE